MPNLFFLSLCNAKPTFFTFYRHVQKKRTEKKLVGEARINAWGSESVWVCMKVTLFQLGFAQKSIHNCCLHLLKMSTWQSVKRFVLFSQLLLRLNTFQWLLLYMSMAQNIFEFRHLYWSRWHFGRLWSNINYLYKAKCETELWKKSR